MIEQKSLSPLLDKWAASRPQPPPPAPLPPTEAKLKLMLSAGPDMPDIVQGLIERHKLPFIIENGELKSALTAGELYLKQFVTVCPMMIKLKDDVRLIAQTEHEVLVVGDTGTGKELIGKSLAGNRKGAIKAVNCAGFPEQLIESELFGHVKGAFTGAESQKQGLMAAAADGVMFLDEIGEMSLSVQAKLLRAIQDKRIRKVGCNVEEEITCKFVCATNRNLKDMVKEGKFRKDLYARISTFELDITPLTDRLCDVIPITESLPDGKLLVDKYRQPLSDGAFDLSLNVRSLQQHVKRFKVLGRVSFK